MLLTHRLLLLSQAYALENDLRVTLRNFGLKVGMVGKIDSRRGLRLVEEFYPTWPEVLVEPMLVPGRCWEGRSSSCIAVCWPLSGMTRCAGA